VLTTGPRRALVALAVAASPVIVAAVLCRALAGGSLSQAIPYANDEIAYWNQVAAFAAAGFRGGFTIVDERPARATFSHFGPHGPAFPLLYGIPARIVGWDYASAPLFGAVAFAAAAGSFMLMSPARPLLAAVVLVSFWPLVLSMPNTMQESLHFAFACLFAAVVVRLLSVDEPPRRLLAVTACLIVVASLVRPVWALVAVPLGWLLWRRKSRVAALTAGAAAGAAVVALYVAFTTLGSPYPDATAFLADFSDRPLETVWRTLRRAAIESPRRWFSLTAEPLEVLFSYELVMIVALAWVLALRHRGGDTPRRLYGFVAATGTIVFAAALALGNIGGWRDYRATTPILLMLLLIAASMRSPIVWIAAAMNLLALLPAMTTFQAIHAPRFQSDRRATIERFAADVRDHLAFDATAPPWSNSVLVHVDRYAYPLLGLPPGFGIAGVISWDRVARPPRSRYGILAPSDLARLDRSRLRKLATTVLGDLYENLDWRR
jgi:hypothetical protein